MEDALARSGDLACRVVSFDFPGKWHILARELLLRYQGVAKEYG